MGDWNRIGCAIDFSDGSRGALAEAESLARRYGADLLLIHVAEPPSSSDLPPPDSALEPVHEAVAARLEEWRAAAERGVGRPVEAVLLDGPAAPTIARAAGDQRIDLLVTATHGRRGFRHLVLGSVVERLVHLAPCSVLVFRA
jgi:nucleotide-binding universal stress UspA family protein